MAINEFLPFATGGGANVVSQVAYAADPQTSLGNQPGLARSNFVNKALRQATYVAANLAQFMSNATGSNVLDDATPANILAVMSAAFKKPPTVTKFLFGFGVYTPPVGVAYIRVRMVGGGGGGSGGGAGPGVGGVGAASTFGTALLVASAGITANLGGAASLGVGPIGIALAGGSGILSSSNGFPNGYNGSGGASSPFGGAGGGVNSVSAGMAAIANTGSGGGGAGDNAGGGTISGGAGGYIDALLNPAMACWAPTFNYAVGIGGAGGAGGTVGGAGATGIVLIEEFYQ